MTKELDREVTPVIDVVVTIEVILGSSTICHLLYSPSFPLEGGKKQREGNNIIVNKKTEYDSSFFIKTLVH